MIKEISSVAKTQVVYGNKKYSVKHEKGTRNVIEVRLGAKVLYDLDGTKVYRNELARRVLKLGLSIALPAVRAQIKRELITEREILIDRLMGDWVRNEGRQRIEC